MLISCRRTREHPILGPICAKYPQCFEEGRSDDWEQLTLTLALLYETTLGLNSFWYPYLRILPEDASDHLPCFWSEYERETFQDEALILELEEFKTEMDFYCDLFQKIMAEHPHVFPEEYRDPDLFMSMFSNVISRCFGTGVDSTSLVPVADNLNHNSIGSTLDVMNKSLHRKGAGAPDYYTVDRFLVDYSAAFQQPGQEKKDDEAATDPQANLMEGLSAEERLNITGRYNRKLYEHNLQALSAANTRLNLQSGMHIWQVPFFEDTHDEDNDTSESEDSDSDSEEEESEKKDKKENALRERHGFEHIIRKEKELLADMQKAKMAAKKAQEKTS